VLRRGPSAWSHVGRWNVETGAYEPGAWIRANLYPQRCDVSPDGRWFLYLTAHGGNWRAGNTYLAISPLPWLTALAAWGTAGTWSRGARFVDDRDVQELGPPDEGDDTPLRGWYGLALNRPATFAVERRHGWAEAVGTPVRAEDDLWDERQADAVVMEKPRPNDPATVLRVRGRYAAFREGPFRSEPRTIEYELGAGDASQSLTDVQWADWGRDGSLLTASADGRLEVRTLDGSSRTDAELGALVPEPQPAPSDARHW
jgi:hypothetical protein